MGGDGWLDTPRHYGSVMPFQIGLSAFIPVYWALSRHAGGSETSLGYGIKIAGYRAGTVGS